MSELIDNCYKAKGWAGVQGRNRP